MSVSKVVERGTTAVEEKLEAVVDSEVPLLAEAGLHIIMSGGKRIRPRLALLAYLAAGGDDFHKVVPMAAAVEMVHTATLVHDDINDHSLTRRGQVTVHAKWGRTFALLTGDYLFTKVYEMMAPYGSDLNEIMATACTRLVEGETLQAVAAKAGTMDRETYKQIISLKTASLFDAAARMGGMVAGADEEVVAALAVYAYNLGLTFQIVDDILDIIGDPETLGKPVGADIVQNRGVMATQMAGHNGSGTAQAATAVATAPDPVQAMLARLRDSGAVEVARMQAQETAARARDALQQVPPSPYRDEMDDLIDAVLDRQN